MIIMVVLLLAAGGWQPIILFWPISTGTGPDERKERLSAVRRNFYLAKMQRFAVCSTKELRTQLGLTIHF
jgi:hypothetical protein